MSNEPFTIRTTNTNDAATIIALMRELAASLNRSDRCVPIESHLRIQLATFGNPQIQGFLAHENGEAVGYCLYYVSGYSSWQSRWRWLHLEDLYVKATHAKRGIGSALMGNLFAQARAYNIDSIRVEIEPTNEQSRNFYRRYQLDLPPQTDWQEFVLTVQPE